MFQELLTLSALMATIVGSPITEFSPQDGAPSEISRRGGSHGWLDELPVWNGTSAQGYGGPHEVDRLPVASDIRISLGRISPNGKIPLCDQAYTEDDPFSTKRYDVFWDLPLISFPFDYYFVWPEGTAGKGTLDISGPGPNGEPCGAYRATIKMPREGCYTVKGYIEGFGGGDSMTCLHYWQDGDQ